MHDSELRQVLPQTASLLEPELIIGVEFEFEAEFECEFEIEIEFK